MKLQVECILQGFQQYVDGFYTPKAPIVVAVMSESISTLNCYRSALYSFVINLRMFFPPNSYLWYFSGAYPIRSTDSRWTSIEEAYLKYADLGGPFASTPHVFGVRSTLSSMMASYPVTPG